MRASAGHPNQLQIMYGIAGERSLPEMEIPWLPGYENSAPVRIGNAASAQVQMDIYGELIDTCTPRAKPNWHRWNRRRRLQRILPRRWSRAGTRKDHGIWEVRGARRAFTHSRLMCWVAIRPGDQIGGAFGLQGPVACAGSMSRDAIRRRYPAARLRSGHEQLRAVLRRQVLDASLLLIPQVGFLPVGDPRVTRHRAGDRKAASCAMAWSSPLLARGVGRLAGPGREASSWHAASGLRTPTPCRAGWTKRPPCSSGCFRCATTWVCWPKNTSPVRRRMVGNFPQAFSHIRLATRVQPAAGPGPGAAAVAQRGAAAQWLVDARQLASRDG